MWQPGQHPLPQWLKFLGAVLLAGFLGLTDYLTGPELSFSIFYLIPISVATLSCGFLCGAAVSLISAMVWLIADLHTATYLQPLVPFWNAFVRLGYFELHTYLLSRLFQELGRERIVSRQDPLTTAANSLHFRDRAAKAIERSTVKGEPLTLAYVDLDNFKMVNDRFGHPAGDEVLRTVVLLMQRSVRDRDLVARVGGDEFVVLLPNTGDDEARTCLNRMRDALDAAMCEGNLPVTFSIGATTFHTPPTSVEAMIRRTDDLMYEVKNGGKNAIRFSVVGHPLPRG